MGYAERNELLRGMGDIGKVMEESRFEDTKGNYMDQV